MHLDIIDQIYEAAVIPELWPKVLDEIARRVDSAGGLLFTVAPDVRWTASEGVYELTQEFVADGWAARNPRPQRAASLDRECFLTDLDVFAEEELKTFPYYTDFMWQRGFGWCAGTLVQVPGGDLLTFSWERHYKDGPFTRAEVTSMNGLRSHLARAGVLANKFGLERARTAVDALQRLGIPAAVISRRKTLLSSNEHFEARIPTQFIDAPSRVRAVDPATDKLLVDALSTMLVSGGNSAKSIPIRSDGHSSKPAVAHLLPIRGHANDIFSSAFCLLLVTEASQRPGAPKEILKGLFDLTAAESRLAQGLLTGEDLQTYAKCANITYDTARSQLRSVLFKTGTHSQMELVRLLSGVSLGARI